MSTFVAVDTGGTFTDLVAFDSLAGQVRHTKSLTTHGNPLEGIMDCIAKAGTTLATATLFKHGTTLVVNTLIERSGPDIALVTTRGFRDVVDLGRGNRSDQYDLFFRRDPPLVARTARLEIDERIDGAGEPLAVPSRTEVEQVAERIRHMGVPAVAVSFLNAYLNPSHEQLVTCWLRELLPKCFVTCGTELSREWYEYERTSTATANAYTGPKVSHYVHALERELAHRGFAGQFLLMGSNGGMLSPGYAMRAPVMLVESGPIGGCIGAGVYGRALGLPNVIAFDMGGTTAKCALVRDGAFDVVSTYYIGGYGRGIPIRTPVIDIVEVGAGGGSVASLDGQLRMSVGPRSAGSMPGPVCYGRGGEEPTVTDANLVLGRLNPHRFQGGEMGLDAPAAERAIRDRIAGPLGLGGEGGGVTEAAEGILALAVVKMSGAIKRVTVERGKDPRDFVLFAYGGGGPLHAVELARELSIPQVVIPPEPGNFSAVGMLLARIRRDEGRTFVQRLDHGAVAPMIQVFDEMATELRRSLAETFGDIPVRVERFAEMRFVGQFHTVRVAIEDADAPSMRRAFEQTYLARYGHLIKSGQVETVSLHVVAYGDTPHPELADLFRRPEPEGQPSISTRKVHFTREGRSLDTAVFDRASLPHGFAAPGPAVIEEYGSTTVVGPHNRFEVGALGELRIDIDWIGPKGEAQP